jgi:uncharacterized protein (DUF1330 family)
MDLTAQEIDELVAAMPIGLLKPAPDGAMEAKAKTLARFASADLVTVMVGGSAGLRREFRGADGFVSAWTDWMGPFDRYESEVLEIMEGAPGKLLIRTRQVATPTGTTVEIESEAAGVIEFEDDRLVRLEFHMDPEAARRAAGLEAG